MCVISDILYYIYFFISIIMSASPYTMPVGAIAIIPGISKTLKIMSYVKPYREAKSRYINNRKFLQQPKEDLLQKLQT